MYIPANLEKVETGIWVNTQATETDAKDIKHHYKAHAIKILEQDRYHYECMRRKFRDLFSEEVYSVADIGGGHPKLASCMNVCGQITVYDAMASMYKSLHSEFAKRYPISCDVEYKRKTITHYNFTPNAELAICCHILEHLSLEQIRKLLGNLETDKLIVYGPNIEVAKSEKWLHFRPNDHRTFCSLYAMRTLMEEAGYHVHFAQAYHEDYLLAGRK